MADGLMGNSLCDLCNPQKLEGKIDGDLLVLLLGMAETSGRNL